MRAIEITIFIIMMSACIGAWNSMAVFPHALSGDDNSQYSLWTVSNLSTWQDKDPSLWDQVQIYFTFFVQGIFWIANILFTVVVIYPTLVNTFMVPPAISAVLQAGIWITYVTGYVQWKTSKSLEGLR